MFFGGDPFDHFGHGGGGRSHRGSRGGGGGAAVDTTKLYDTLGVSDKVRCCFLLNISTFSFTIGYRIFISLADQECQCPRYQKSVSETCRKTSSR